MSVANWNTRVAGPIHSAPPHRIRCRCALARLAWSLLLLGMAAGLSLGAWAGPVLYAFGDGKIAVPSSSPVGTVVSREYYTPQQLCEAATCTLSSTVLYPKGNIISGSTPGPDIETRVSGLSMRILADGVPLRNTTSITVRSGIEVQLFLDGRRPQDGTLKPGFFNPYAIINYNSGLFGDSASLYLSPQVQFIAGTCTVPSKSVTLASASSGDFKGVGSGSHRTMVELEFNDCPAGFNQISFQIMAANGKGSLPGTLLPQPESTARGVAIRLSDILESGLPLVLGASYPTPYKGQAGSYRKVLGVEYVQTEPVIIGGSIRASALVFLDYR